MVKDAYNLAVVWSTPRPHSLGMNIAYRPLGLGRPTPRNGDQTLDTETRSWGCLPIAQVGSI